MTGRSLDDRTRFMQLLGGKWITAAVSAAADVRLGDAFEAGREDLATLAERTSTLPSFLLRLLRVLAGVELVHEHHDGTFELLPLGELLREEHFAATARYVGTPFLWAPFARLADTLRTGETAFSVEHGVELFEYVGASRQTVDEYYDGVDAFTRRDAIALINGYDFDDALHVVDVGGGNGTFLRELLKQAPHLRGTLVDLPHVIDAVEPSFEEQRDRSSFVRGSFFEPLPSGASVYVLKRVLHNWDDVEALKILQRVREAMEPGARLLVVEGVLLPGNLLDGTRLMDVEMMAICRGGRERSKGEFRRLFRDADLRLECSLPLDGDGRLLVLSPRIATEGAR